MKLYFMKTKALDYLKTNMDTLYVNYYRENTNKWIYDLFDYEPFEYFTEIDTISMNRNFQEKGKMELQNCKNLYIPMKNISRSQATDERLWAGLCNETFYSFIRERWDYPRLTMSDPEKDLRLVLARFFFAYKETIHRACYTNTLSKFWWIGNALYDASKPNEFEYLDGLGPERFYTKIHDMFFSNNFSSNPQIAKGICKGWSELNKRGINLSVEKHFRPGLKYLNAVGGCVLLDSLSEDEIAELFSGYIASIYTGDDFNPIFTDEDNDDSNDDSNDENETLMAFSEEIDFMQETEKAIKDELSQKESQKIRHIGEKKEQSKKMSDIINTIVRVPEEVTYGTTVRVYREKSNESIEYNIPETEDAIKYTIQKQLLSKKVGDTIFCAGSNYTVEEIKW